MEKFLEIGKQYEDLSNQLRKASLDYIHDLLKKQEGESIDVVDDIQTSITVTYDGGRHPEYDTNAFSVVETVYLKDDKVTLAIEDCEEYDAATRLNTSEIYTIADELYTSFGPLVEE